MKDDSGGHTVACKQAPTCVAIGATRGHEPLGAKCDRKIPTENVGMAVSAPSFGKGREWFRGPNHDIPPE